MKKSDYTKGESSSHSLLQWGLRVFRGWILAIMMMTLCLFIGSYCISIELIGQHQMTGIVYGSCVVGALGGGIFAIGRQGTRSLPLGLSVGTFLVIFIFAVGVLWYKMEEMSNGGVGVILACLCGGTMAGILCKKRQKRDDKRKTYTSYR